MLCAALAIKPIKLLVPFGRFEGISKLLQPITIISRSRPALALRARPCTQQNSGTGPPARPMQSPAQWLPSIKIRLFSSLRPRLWACIPRGSAPDLQAPLRPLRHPMPPHFMGRVGTIEGKDQVGHLHQSRQALASIKDRLCLLDAPRRLLVAMRLLNHLLAALFISKVRLRMVTPCSSRCTLRHCSRRFSSRRFSRQTQVTTLHQRITVVTSSRVGTTRKVIPSPAIHTTRTGLCLRVAQVQHR